MKKVVAALILTSIAPSALPGICAKLGMTEPCITSADIGGNQITAADIAPNAVTSTKLAPSAVTSTRLAPDSVGTIHLRENVLFGKLGDDGDVTLSSETGATTIIMDGATGTVSQSLGADGLVKAWAKINADGTVASCYKCNTDPLETRNLDMFGSYEVDFTPLSDDIRSRPRLLAPDLGVGMVFARILPSDLSSLDITVWNSEGSPAGLAPFTIFIF